MSVEQFSGEAFQNVLASGIIGSIIAIGIMAGILIGLAIYIYFALSWREIARKLNYKNDWVAWIPLANIAMMLQLGGFHWAWIFLILIPIFGWIAIYILLIIATWRIFSKLNYPGWFSLSLIIPKVGGILYLVAIGFVAWSKGGKKIVSKKVLMRKAPKKKTRKRK